LARDRALRSCSTAAAMVQPAVQRLAWADMVDTDSDDEGVAQERCQLPQQTPRPVPQRRQQRQKQMKNQQPQRQGQQRQPKSPKSPTSPLEDSPPNSDPLEWERRQQRREDAVRKTKALPLYLATLKICHVEGDEGRPQTPTPSDRSLRKRMWETDVAQWKEQMRLHCECYKRHLTTEEVKAIQRKSER